MEVGPILEHFRSSGSDYVLDYELWALGLRIKINWQLVKFVVKLDSVSGRN